jgi:uncharacterized protein (DUF58 family)
MPFVGPLATDVGGPGVEFHSTREYRASDPRNRIDWRSYAKTGELTTINYREHRAARVVVVVDARAETRVAAHPGTPNGGALGAYAGLLALQALSEDGHAVGLAVFGLADDAATGRAPAWISSDASDVRERAERLCTAAAVPAEADADLDTSPTASADTQLDRLVKRLPADAQVLFVSAAVDDFPIRVANDLRTHDHVVTVVSPDALSPVGDGASAGQWEVDPAFQDCAQRLVGIDRSERLRRLRALGVPVVDWNQATALPLALTTALDPLVTEL